MLTLNLLETRTNKTLTHIYLYNIVNNTIVNRVLIFVVKCYFTVNFVA